MTKPIKIYKVGGSLVIYRNINHGKSMSDVQKRNNI